MEDELKSDPMLARMFIETHESFSLWDRIVIRIAVTAKKMLGLLP